MSAAERARARFAAWRLDLALAAVLVASVAALYAPTARHAFVSFDDGAYLTENPRVSGGLTAENVRWAFTEFHSANWHPLTWLSHQLDVELFELVPGPHHLVSAALHALNALLCFAFFRRATGSSWASALVALLFAVHPQRVESVAWASERKDVLSSAFFFLTLLAYERHARAPSPRRLALVAACLALGLLAKPMLVTVPLVLLLLDLWPLARLRGPGTAPEGSAARGGRTVLLEKLPLLVLAGASALVTLVAQRAGGAVQPMEVLSLGERVSTAVLGTVAYLAKASWPSGLAFFYPHPALVAPQEFAPFGAPFWLAALLLLALTAAAWRLRARFPMCLAGWGWMLVMLLPVIGLVQVGAQFTADRYAYLPLLGPTFALVFLVRELLPSGAQRMAYALALGAALILAVLARRQVATWRDSQALCARALEVTEKNYVAHEHMGLFLQRALRLEEARAHYEAALAFAPNLPSSHSNLGAVHAQLGQREQALACFERALRLVPDFLTARMSLGFLREADGDHAGAAEHYAIAARQHPESSEAWTRLGDALLAAGRPAEARDACRDGLVHAQGSAELHAALGEALGELGDAPAALASFTRAEALVPGHARARHGRAWLHATSAAPGARDPARALALLEDCRARDGEGWQHLRVLAAALAAAGKSAEAVRVAAEASALAPKAQWERLKAERELYAQGRALER